MGMNPKDIENLRARLDKIGEEQVRLNLGMERYNPDQTVIVELWLKEREQEREGERRVEDLELARSANRLAWVALTVASLALFWNILEWWFTRPS